jgi:hypothetical protein
MRSQCLSVSTTQGFLIQGLHLNGAEGKFSPHICPGMYIHSTYAFNSQVLPNMASIDVPTITVR